MSDWQASDLYTQQGGHVLTQHPTEHDAYSDTEKDIPSTPGGGGPSIEVVAQRPHLNIIIPTVSVLIGTAGVATVLLMWMLLRKTQDSLHDVWTARAFILDEGTTTEGGVEAARLSGLIISSAASKAVGLTTPVLLGLYAFHIARIWLLNTSQEARMGDLPTPLQYGLTLDLLSGAGLGSLVRTGQYLYQPPSRRARSSSMLIRAFWATSVIYSLTHAIGAVDLWLHTVAASIIIPTDTPINQTFNFSIAQDRCPPYPNPWYEAVFPCLMGSGAWGLGITDLTPGMLVTSNSSEDLRTISLADADDLAVLTRVDVPQLITFRATTFGARASCQSLNTLCGLDGDDIPPGNCTGFDSSFPPVTGDEDGSLQQGDSKVFIQSSNCPTNTTCPHISSSEFTDSDPLSAQIPPVNAYSLWLQFLWQSEGDEPFGDPPAGNEAATSYSNLATMLANCTLSFYNVTLDYKNGSYIRVKEELSNVGLSDGLAGPTQLGHYASHLISNIEGIAFTANSTETVMAFLNQDLARLALGSAATITNLRAPTLSQSQLGTAILARYPFWPVVVMIAMLYVHAGIALAIFLTTLIHTHGEAVRLRTSDGDVGAKVSTLALAQMRLQNVLPLVAELFPPDEALESRTAASVQTSATKVFRERGHDVGRVHVGTHVLLPSQVGAHAHSPVFGIWRRRQHEGSGEGVEPLIRK